MLIYLQIKQKNTYTLPYPSKLKENIINYLKSIEKPVSKEGEHIPC